MIITIDGTSGTGKSSVAELFAKKHRFLHLNSGLYYRAITFMAIEAGISATDHSLLNFILKRVTFLPDEIQVDGQAVDIETLKSDRISQAGVEFARIPGVRSLVNSTLKQNAAGDNTIVEGRNIGIEVFPGASFKFFLECSDEVTARRMANAMKISYNEALKSITQRDNKDKSRSISPLAIPIDATRIDTSKLTILQTMELIEKYVFE